MNSISDPHRLLFNLTDKMNLTKVIKMLLYQILKTSKTENLKHRLQLGMKSFNYLMIHILYQIFKIKLRLSSKKLKQ